MTGAMLSGVESSTEIQRQVATRKRVIGYRVASLAESASPLTGPEAVFARLAEMAVGLAVGFTLEDSVVYLQEKGPYADKTYFSVEWRQLRGRVKSALAEIGATQRRVIEHHSLKHLPFEDVASLMPLTRGHISQIHKEALHNLRARLTKTDAIASNDAHIA